MNIKTSFKNNHSIKFALWSDAPPLINIGNGCHGISKQILKACDKQIPLLITQRYRRKFSKKEIQRAAPSQNIFFYPSSALTGIRRFFPNLANILDLLLFILYLPLLLSVLKKNNIQRILTLFGADGFSLWQVLILTIYKTPIDIYLVDDLEESARKNHRYILKKLLPWLEPFTLRRCSRVFTICPGYSEYLAEKYGLKSTPLYLPIFQPPKEIQPLKPAQPKFITFIGALNFLYLSSLLSLYSIILKLNENKTEPSLILQIITYSDPKQFLNKITNANSVLIHQNVPTNKRIQLLESSWATFLPYSFSEDERIMVKTSFSCKILEYLNCGRPIIVYGPQEASTPRHFLENSIPLCATNIEELKRTIEQLDKEGDNLKNGLSKAYDDLWLKYHSPAVFLNTYISGNYSGAIRAEIRGLKESFS